MPNLLKALLVAAAGGAAYLLIRSQQRTPFPPPIRTDVQATPDGDGLTTAQQDQLLRELGSQL